MKKIIGIVFIILMFANIGYAEMRLIEDTRIRGRNADYYVATLCIDGYKFVEFSYAGQSSSMVQFFVRTSIDTEDWIKKLVLPQKC